MSLQFSRSLRILRLDSFRAARFGLLLAAVNMAALLAWFFLAHVTLYEVSDSIQPGIEGRFQATFPGEVVGRIHTGQAAWLRLDPASDGQAVKVPVIVYDVSGGSAPPDNLPGSESPERVAVEFVVIAPDFPIDLAAEKLKGRVEVEVEYVTPVELVMRTSGKFLNQNRPSVSPGTGGD